MRVAACICMYTYVWRMNLNLRHLPLCLWRQDLSLNQDLTDPTSLVSQAGPGAPVSTGTPSPVPRLQVDTTTN